MLRISTILVGVVLAGFALAQHEAPHGNEPTADGELVDALDLLDTDLASNGITAPFNSIVAVGPAVVPLLCERLMRPRMFAADYTSTRESVSNLLFAFLAMKEAHPETVTESIDCLYRWSLKTSDSNPSWLYVQSTVAGLFGDQALSLVVAAWQRYGDREDLFERNQKVANSWFKVFCLDEGREAATIDELARLADGLEQYARLNLYSHISTLAACSDRATDVIKLAFDEEKDADAKRTLYRIRMQARTVRQRQKE